MTTLEIIAAILILMAALGSAVWNALVKTSKNSLQFAALMVVPQFWVALPIALSHWPVDHTIWFYLVASSVTQTIYILYLSHVYTKVALSLIYPLMLGLAPIFNLLLWVTLGQAAFTALELSGLFIICVGLITLTLTEKKFYRPHFNKRLTLDAFIIAGLICTYAAIDTFGIRQFNDVSYISCLFTLKALILFIPMVLFKQLSLANLKHDKFNYIVAGLLAGAGYSIAVWSFSIIHSPIVLSLRATSIVFAVLVARIMLKELVQSKRAVVSIVIFLGVILVLV